MVRYAGIFAITVLLSALYCNPAPGQGMPRAILELDIENVVEYQPDISDPSKFGTNPDITPSAGTLRLRSATVLGDIVAVNGQPAKGTFVGLPWAIGLNPGPSPKGNIADTTRISIGYRTFEILKSDGTPVGTIMAFGLNGGSSPPGAPFSGQNFAIVGGTGAFLAVRGEQGGKVTTQSMPPRAASIAENPANRRINGGGKVRWVLAVIPMSVPQIVAVTHSSDSTLVTPSKPATPREILSLRATGLGPTVPRVDFGKPFPASPPSAVNSPLDVIVNGKSAEVLSAVGDPGTIDAYTVTFRVPPDTAGGTATIQVIAAWIAGPETRMSIQ